MNREKVSTGKRPLWIHFNFILFICLISVFDNCVNIFADNGIRLLSQLLSHWISNAQVNKCCFWHFSKFNRTFISFTIFFFFLKKYCSILVDVRFMNGFTIWSFFEFSQPELNGKMNECICAVESGLDSLYSHAIRKYYPQIIMLHIVQYSQREKIFHFGTSELVIFLWSNC